MDHSQTLESANERFFSSKKSRLGKTRQWLWLSLGLGFAISIAGNKGSIGSLLFSAVFMILLGGTIDWFLRRQLKAGQPLVTLSRDAIESPIFLGKTKRYQWSDIVGVSVESNQNAQWIKLQLAESLGLPDKRSFWTGTNHARPSIPISSFEPEVQEKLLEAIHQRVGQRRADAGKALQPLINSLTEEREFQERLKSFAPTPWITYLIIAINVLVWVLTVANGASVLHAPTDKLFFWGGNAASEVQRGDYWRLLTAIFLHSGLMHLAMNMLGLASAGITVERIYGHRLFILIYLGSGLVGSALSLHFSAQHAVSVGASGAVFGVAGALLVGVFQHRHQLPKTFGKQTLSSLGFFIIYSLMQGFTKPGIDNAAHVGGLIGGCLLAYILPERFDMEHFIRTLKSRAIAGIVVVFAATTGLAAIAPPAAVDQKKAFEGLAAFLRGMQGFTTAAKAMQQEHQDLLAGKLTERQVDDRSRTVHAPEFRKILQDLSQASFPPSDPRLPILKEAKRMTELLLESQEMQSVYKPGSNKPEPADPERMVAINAELKEVSSRFQRSVQDATAKAKH